MLDSPLLRVGAVPASRARPPFCAYHVDTLRQIACVDQLCGEVSDASTTVVEIP